VATKKHGNAFGYTNVNYINAKTPILIFCKKHELHFEATPDSHTRQQCGGCPACLSEVRRNFVILSHEDWLKRSIEVHGDRWNYTLSEYKTGDEYVDILCLKHGLFSQTARSHLTGRGCPSCGRESTTKKRRSTTKEFVVKAKKKHIGKYDYSKSHYHNAVTSVIITCPKHGDFKQTPRDHLAGHGCQKCKESWGEAKIRESLESKGRHYLQEVRFDSCKRKRSLPFDFLVNKMLIEFQGQQHYAPSKRHKDKIAGIKGLINTLRSDDIKQKWCQNRLPLLLIPFWDIDRIPEILDDVLDGKEPTFSSPPEAVIDAEPIRQKIRDKLGITEPEILCGLIRPEAKEEAA
jgi:hypothetical protein